MTNIGTLKNMTPKQMHPDWFNGDDYTPKHCDAFRNIKPVKHPAYGQVCATCKGHGKWHVRGSVDNFGKNTWTDCDCPDCGGRGFTVKWTWFDYYTCPPDAH